MASREQHSKKYHTMKQYKKIGEGRYQKVYRLGDKVLKIAYDIKNPSTLISRMEKYHQTIKSAGIKVPDYFGAHFSKKDKKIITQWSYAGKPIKEKILKDDKEKVMSILEQVLNMGLIAYNHNIAFYPILEQFTILKKDVYFVDFFPPRTEKDFKDYPKEKRSALSLLFYGLPQKILTPVKGVISLRPDLRKDTIDFSSSFLKKNHLKGCLDDILNIN